MGKNKQKKQKLPITPTPIPTPAPAKPIKEVKKKKKKKTPSLKSKSKPENIPKLLKLYSKEQIIDLAIDSALLNPNLVAKIQEFADSDVPHREIFVYGLSKSSTDKNVFATFSQFGEIESCHVVKDRATGQPKGFAFIVYKTRKSAVKALKQPKKFMDNRVVNCQLASVGRGSSGNVVASDASTRTRKIFVSNVMGDVNPEKLRIFFSRFGEIEGGPFGLDPITGKCKGYALFVYKTLEGVKKVLEEPDKVFEGRHLHCEMALDGEKASGGAAGITKSVQIVPPVYAAPANGQSMGSLAPNPNANPNGGLLLHNPNANVNGGMMGSNALPAGRFYGNPNPNPNVNPYGGHGQLIAGGMPMGNGGYNGTLGNYSLRGLDTMPGLDRGAGSSSSQPMMQGYMNAYPSSLVAPRTSYAGNPPFRPFR